MFKTISFFMRCFSSIEIASPFGLRLIKDLRRLRVIAGGSFDHCESLAMLSPL